jgi:N-acetylated-alpha-linked acidic dipeptidase
LCSVAGVLSAALALAASPDLAKISGFSPRTAAQEIITENSFRESVSTPEIIQFHRYLTAEPHPAGSARNNELAQWVAEQWRQQGLEDVTVHQYDVLGSSPRKISLEMVKPTEYHALLLEAPDDVDPDTRNPKVDGAYLGYSASGEVTAPVVYAHSGN